MKRASLFLLAAALLAAPLTGGLDAAAQDDQMQVEGRYAEAEGSFTSPFVTVADKLKPAVVFVEVLRETEVRMPFHGFDPFEHFFGPRPDRDEEPETRKVPSSGSGVIIDAEGLVVTNNHVVEDAIELTVKLADGSQREAEIVGRDPETDLALLKIGEVSEENVARLGDSGKLRIGEWAIAMGNPMGLEWTLTVGVVSAKGRANLAIAGGGPTFQDFIQTDASINFGNSGGPLANIRGEVIGINAAINARAENIGFAIPINMVKQVVEQLREHGEVRRGYLGMLPRPLTPIMKEAVGVDEDVEGVFVETVEPNTPAEEGGLMAGDVIVEMDGEPVDNVNDFRFRIARHEPGDKMTLTVIRKGDRRELDFRLGDRADLLAQSGRPTDDEEKLEAWMGLEVANLNHPRVRSRRLEVSSGVIILKVEDDSPAAGKMRPGDVIAEVDKQPVEDMSDWREIVSDLGDTDKAVLIKYHPQGQSATRFVALKK